MLGLDFVEWIGLIHIIFIDLQKNHLTGQLVKLYFWVVTVSLVVQLLGTLLAALGWYRVGGVLQIASSSIHVVKGEGLIGVIGGLKAYRYPSLLPQQAGAASGSATS